MQQGKLWNTLPSTGVGKSSCLLLNFTPGQSRTSNFILELVFHCIFVRDMSYEQLQLFVGMCPSTRQVNLYVDEDLGHLLSPLHSLAHLQELKLLACNFYSDRVDRLVREQGHRLTLLHLEHVDELDMSALSLIALCCPALEKLVFFSCDFVENFGSSPEGFPEPPFRQLTHLVCVSESAPNVIEFLLASDNLENHQNYSIFVVSGFCSLLQC